MKLTNRCLYVCLYVSLIRLSLLNLTRGLLLVLFFFFSSFTVLPLFVLLSFKDSFFFLFLYIYIKFEEIQDNRSPQFLFFFPREEKERKLQDEHFSQMQISHATEHGSRDSPGEVYRRTKGTIIFKAITQGRPVKRNIS